MVLPRTGHKQLAQYEAFTVLAEGCRHLANNCVTKGARGILKDLADSIDRNIETGNYVNIGALLVTNEGPVGEAS